MIFIKIIKKIDTFKLQHYFHAAILDKNDLIKVRKKKFIFLFILFVFGLYKVWNRKKCKELITLLEILK